jgi:nucleotide-binding universal stress UspA family protein
MKTLLAIIDQPKESKEFIRYVAAMSVNLMRKVHLVYVNTPANYPYGVPDATGQASVQLQQGIEQQIEESEKMLKNLRAEIAQEMSMDVFSGQSSEIGVAADITNDMVSQNKADMVVMEGIKDKSIWEHPANNMDVIKNAKCPVWIVPKGAIYKPAQQIVYATDFKEEDVFNLIHLTRLFPHLAPHITALHITDNPDFEERVKKEGFVEMVQKKTAYRNLNVKALFQNKKEDTVEMLNEYANKKKGDLVVILKENKSFFKRIFQSSTTKKILKSTQLPVLIYHEKA